MRGVRPVSRSNERTLKLEKGETGLVRGFGCMSACFGAETGEGM